MRTRCRGGSLLVIKGLNDCVTIERGGDGNPEIVSVEGEWNAEELKEAKERWDYPSAGDARRR